MAIYKRDLKLYKIGLSNKKPSHPITQMFHKFLSPIFNQINQLSQDIKLTFKLRFFSKRSFFGKLYNKYNQFISKTLPQKINKLVFDTAIIGIKGYRTIQSDCKYLRNIIQSKDSIRYISNIINQANVQVSRASSFSTTPKASRNELSFKDSLKVPSSNTNGCAYNSNISVRRKSNTIRTDSFDYEYLL